jgi:protein O-GlcNAc transferase
MNNQQADTNFILDGNEYLDKKDLTRAALSYLDAIKANPSNEIAYCNLGNIYLDLGQIKEAIRNYKKAIIIKPNYTNALCNLGAAYGRLGELKKALVLYQKVIEIDPNHQTVYIFLGNILLAQGSFEEAETCYRMAIEKDATSAQAYNNLGTALARQQLYLEASKAYKEALRLDKSFRVALSNLGTAYVAADKTKQAIKYYSLAYLLEPNNSSSVANLYHQLRAICDWDRLKPVEKQLDKLTKKELSQNIKTGEEPFINVIRCTNKAINLKLATLWSKFVVNSITHRKKFTFIKPSPNRKRIRIAYFSAHFHDHPTGHLISRLFASHDRELFEVYVYSCGLDDKSKYYKKIKESCDKFMDLTFTNFSDSAMIINQQQIDILIELDGYTDNNRMQIMALRPAPIQATYLGFPGTTGAEFIDYLITDDVVTPKGHKEFYSERLVSLPPSYQVNDSTQTVMKGRYKRSDFKLPAGNFIFCCFNGNYKIEPGVFGLWMKILARVPKSVLWLLKTNQMAEDNLKKEAIKAGINPKRLIFAHRLPREKHLGRLTLADLALDTLICNGHTTTSDCLWAGVPVLTLLGKHFASRVAGSILTSAGLKGLITKNKEAYEELAVELARNPQKLSTFKRTLWQNHKISPLFNTEIFTQNLETAYETMWDIYKKGLKPKEITIK